MSVFDQLEARHPEIKFELYPTVKGDTKRVYLTGFMVPYSMRGKGLGTEFMEDLIKTADENGFKVTLTPSSSYGGNVTRLKAFYKGFGFVENKGNNRDFSHREDMYKDPKGLNEHLRRLKQIMGIVTETRQGMLNWLKDKLPNTPEYVIRDWVYKMVTQSDDISTNEGITEWVDMYVKDMKWETKTNFPITMDIFTDNTKKQLENRIGGEVRQDVDKDTERHGTQKELLQSQGISKEPIILFKTKNGKYELGEGWHRTTQTFIQFPDGFIQPNVYIGLNAKWLD